MISTTSTPWFVCNPEYNKIDIPDEDDIEIHQQAIDTSDSRSADSDVEFSVNSDKMQNESDHVEDIPTDTTKEEQLIQPTQTVTLDTTNRLTEDLELLSTIHFESSKRVQRTEALAQQQRSNVKYTYFSTTDDEDEIPSQLQVQMDENETENDKLDENQKNSTQRRSKTTNFTSPIDALSYKFKNYDYIQPISNQKYEELNSIKVVRNPPQEVIRLTRTKVKMPADYMEFNERRRKKDKNSGPTLMSGTSQVKSELTKTKKNTNEQIFENYKKRCPPSPHDPTQTKPVFENYEWKKIDNNEPTFVKRPKVDREKLRKKTESKPSLYRERKVKTMPHSEPIPIPHVEKTKIKNKAPTCANYPEYYTQLREQRRAQREAEEMSKRNLPLIEEEEEQGEDNDSEEKVSLPDNKRLKRQCLKKFLEETEAEEWQVQEPTIEISDESDFIENDGQENDFAVSKKYLTNEDDEDSNNFFKPKPVYYDPHETKAVRLRNQTIKQKLALRKMQQHLEEEEDDERELKRRMISKKIAPSLKKLEMMTQYRESNLDDLMQAAKEGQTKREMEILSVVRSAKNTQFIVERENKKAQVRSEKNAEKKQKEHKTRQIENAKLTERGARKKKLLDLWKL